MEKLPGKRTCESCSESSLRQESVHEVLLVPSPEPGCSPGPGEAQSVPLTSARSNSSQLLAEKQEPAS